MKEDKAYILRKTLVIFTVMLVFITGGFLLVSAQTKNIVLNYYGDIVTVKTVSTTVGGFLNENQIRINEDMEITPSVDTIITKDMEIIIKAKENLAKIDIAGIYEQYNPVVAKIIEEAEIIPFEEEKIDNPVLDRGITKVSKEGTDGEKVTKYIVKYLGETEIYRATLQTDVKTEAENKVIEVGTKLNTVVSRSNEVVIPTVDANFRQYNIKLPVEQQQYAYSMCQNYGVSYELFLSIMYKESGYNPNAIGGGNSYGLSQIHVSNHYSLMNKLGISDFLDPYDNIKAGAYMFSLYMGSARKISGDNEVMEVYALNAYNMGEGNYYNSCYANGILHREYSTSIRSIRDRLIVNGGL